MALSLGLLLLHFKYINNFKPLLDAYFGPYKDKFIYWTGLQFARFLTYVHILRNLPAGFLVGLETSLFLKDQSILCMPCSNY